MPKPVLSDSLFNADDVATAVLAEANLQITNSQLGITNLTSVLQYQNNFEMAWSNIGDPVCYAFNGFIFLNGYVKSSNYGASPTNILYINNSSFHPSEKIVSSTISRGGDHAFMIFLDTDGYLKGNNLTDEDSDNTIFLAFNLVGRYT
jgi:hypothetical protein